MPDNLIWEKNSFLSGFCRTCKGPETQLTVPVDPRQLLYMRIWDQEKVRYNTQTHQASCLTFPVQVHFWTHLHLTIGEDKQLEVEVFEESDDGV